MNNGTDQSVRMHRLICVVVLKCHKQVFSSLAHKKNIYKTIIEPVQVGCAYLANIQNQFAHPRSLIRVLCYRLKNGWNFGNPHSAHQRL